MVEVADAVLLPLLRKRRKTSNDLASIAGCQSNFKGLRLALAEFEAKRDREVTSVRYSPA